MNSYDIRKIVDVGYLTDSTDKRAIDYAMEMKGMPNNLKLELFDTMLAIMAKHHPTTLCRVVRGVVSRIAKLESGECRSKSVVDDIDLLIAKGRKIEAIKLWRDTYKVDLRTAKLAVEARM